MLRRLARRVQRRPRHDHGLAMITAVSVMLVTTTLVSVEFNETLHSISSSAIAKKSLQATSAAESGLNDVIEQVEAGATSGSLPCGTGTTGTGVTWPTFTTFGTYPASIVATSGQPVTNPAQTPTSSQLVYYTTATPSAATAITTCSLSTAQSASVTSVATSLPANLTGAQTVQALLSITQVVSTTSQLPDAIFGNTGLALQNGANLSGSNVELYSNASNAANLPCSNGVLAGTIAAPSVTTGSWGLTNSCVINGNVYSNASMSFSTSSAAVKGTIYTSGSLTVNNPPNTPFAGVDVGGSITVPVGGQAKTDTSGTCPTGSSGFYQPANNQGSFSSSAVCKAGDSTVAATVAAQYQAFPQLDFNPTTAPTGWSIFTETKCSSALTDLAFYANQSTGKWIFNAGSCPISFNNNSFTVSNDLMIITTGAITSTNNGSFTASSAHNLYIVVPYAEGSASSLTTTSCTSGGTISVGPPPTFTNLDVLYYSPCSVTFSNSVTMTGQIYSGATAGFSGSAPNLTYTQMTVPLAIAGSAGGSSSSSASVSWERQPN